MTSGMTEPVGAHSDQGTREYQQDAYDYNQFADPDRWCVAVADGLGFSSGSDMIANAAVGLAVKIAEHVAADHPALVLEITRAVLPEMARYAAEGSRAAHHLEAFGDDTTSRSVADTALVVATITEFGEVHVSWLGDCRAYILTVDGRLIQLTDDHNRASIGRPDFITRTLRVPGGVPMFVVKSRGDAWLVTVLGEVGCR